jgi:hypothetical protein
MSTHASRKRTAAWDEQWRTGERERARAPLLLPAEMTLVFEPNNAPRDGLRTAGAASA